MSRRQHAAEAALFDQTDLLPKKRLIIVFTALAVSLLTSFIDQNSIGVALPTIGRDLNAQATVTWAGTSSLIANTVFQVLYGRLSDIFGRKVVFLSALGLLSAADLLCGFSQNATMLYVFRGLAGVASGGIISLSMMIVSDIVTLKERGKYQGILGGCVGMGNAVGPFLAATFTQRATWRALFWFICPLAAVCGFVAFLILPSNMPTEKFSVNAKKIDYWGVLTGSAATILLLIPISGGGSYFAWNSPMVIAMLTTGGLFTVAFFFVEYKVATLPMMPLYLFKNPPVAAILFQNFFFGMVFYSNIYYLPLYYQNVRGWTPTVSATLILPMVLAQTCASIASGQYISRLERYGEVIWSGFFCWTLAAGLICSFNRTTSPAVIAVVLVIQGISIGFVFQPTLIAIQAHCTKAQRAVVISNRNFIRSLGGAIGLATSAAVLQNTLKKSLPPAFAYLAMSTYSVPVFTAAQQADKDSVLNAYEKASRAVFIFQAPLIGLCLIACILVKDRGLERPLDEKEKAMLNGEAGNAASPTASGVATPGTAMEEKAEPAVEKTETIIEEEIEAAEDEKTEMVGSDKTETVGDKEIETARDEKTETANERERERVSDQ